MTILARIIVLAFISQLMMACSSPPKRDAAYAPVRPLKPLPVELSRGSIYQANIGLSLYEDHKARRVGDILTVVLSEQTDASKKASTSTGRDNSVALAAPTVAGRGILSPNGNPIFSASVNTNMAFEGEGDSSQSNSLSGSVTVSVVEVLSNGYLVIRGEKVISLNQGDEHIRLSGIVRPSDIRADNSVFSTQVADAQITYGGSGVLADANNQGWLSKFFMKIWPF